MQRRDRIQLARGAAIAAMLIVSACGVRKGGEMPAAPQPPEYHGFGPAQRVTLRGYSDDAMEPFVTRDGRYLLFNNRNDPRIDTKLHYAERIDDLTFDYRGEIRGVNTPVLEGVPSLDRLGNLYFVSTRSYRETLSTIYRGHFDSGTVSGVQLVEGVSRREPGIVNFDAEISADGNVLFFVEGRFTGGPDPQTADIAVAIRDGNVFRRLPIGRELLRQVNTDALEYAPAISSDLLELFFTRLDRSRGSVRLAILRSTRANLDAPFGPPERVASIAGFVEAPALSDDGRSLYFHKLEGDRFAIFRVAR
jgi:Tol biopolymer transport system component